MRNGIHQELEIQLQKIQEYVDNEVTKPHDMARVSLFVVCYAAS